MADVNVDESVARLVILLEDICNSSLRMSLIITDISMVEDDVDRSVIISEDLI